MSVRPLNAILEGADVITERRERVAYVATLYERGEVEAYGKALVLGLMTSWRAARNTVEAYVREVEAAAALAARPDDRTRLVAAVVGRYRRAERRALRDPSPARAARAAVAAITGEAKVLGLVPSAVPAPAPAPQSATSGKAGLGPGLRLVDRHGRDLSPKRTDDTEGEGSAAAGDRGGKVLLGGTAKTPSSYL